MDEIGAPPLLEVEGVTLQYKTKHHLVTATYRVGFEVYRGDRFVLLGPVRLRQVDAARRRSAASCARSRARSASTASRSSEPGPDRMMVFQEFDQLLPWKTVQQNVMFPLLASGRCGAREARERALGYIAKVGLDELRRRLSAHAVGRHEAARGDRARAWRWSRTSC